MRIVHLTTLHPPLDVRIFEKECRTLVAAGHDVHLLAFATPEGEQDGVVLHSLGVDPARPGLGRLARRLAAAWRAARRLEAQVYHLHDPELIPVAVLLRLSGRRVVYDAHEETRREVIAMHPGRPFGRFLSVVWTVAEWICGASVTAVVAATPSIARRFPGRKTIVVRNYPKLEEAEQFLGGPHAERPPQVVYVGGLTAIRGARELVGAMARVTHPEAKLVLAGQIDPPELEAELRGSPGWERVDLRGWLPRSGVAAVLREGRVAALPFLPVAGHQDALPNKLFEYMAAGLPVVASRFALWREIVEGAGGGVVVDPRDSGGIAAAIDRLLTDEQEAAEMGARGRAAFESMYSWDGEAAKLLALYERLAHESTSQ